VAAVLGAVGEGLFEIGVDEGNEGPLRRGYGGDVANVCVMAARAGIGARLATRVGDDALGRRCSPSGGWTASTSDTSG
jgi:2-dehydro-3-deoxygluconokinase